MCYPEISGVKSSTDGPSQHPAMVDFLTPTEQLIEQLNK